MIGAGRRELPTSGLLGTEMGSDVLPAGAGCQLMGAIKWRGGGPERTAKILGRREVHCLFRSGL